jgi:hypothetical protein
VKRISAPFIRLAQIRLVAGQQFVKKPFGVVGILEFEPDDTRWYNAGAIGDQPGLVSLLFLNSEPGTAQFKCYIKQRCFAPNTSVLGIQHTNDFSGSDPIAKFLNLYY